MARTRRGSPIRPLIERILGGRLTDVLVELRSQSMSHERMARELHLVHGIEVSGEQVRQWCKESNVEALVEARKAQPDKAAS